MEFRRSAQPQAAQGLARRAFLKKAGIAGTAVAAWTAPQIMSGRAAFAQGSVPCVGDPGFFTWNRSVYTNAQRSGSPGSANPMTNAAGWASHPTFTDTSYTTTTGVTITYRLEDFGFLNTSGTTPEGHGVSNATGSATFKSYRISKDGNPTLDDAMTIVIQFSTDVTCATLVIGDIDNQLPTGTATDAGTCTGTNTPTASRWADQISAVGYTDVDAGGSTVDVVRIAGAVGSGTNVTPGVGTSGPWNAIGCGGIAQTSNASDLTLQVDGTIRELRLDYISDFQDTVSTGNQHIALGDITFFF
jgi:hypothetical protein